MQLGTSRFYSARQTLIRLGLVGPLTVAPFAWAAPAPDFVRNGEAGFVVSHIEYALSQDAEETGACPNGLSLQMEEIFKLTPIGRRTPGESDEAYQQRLEDGREALSTLEGGENICMHPELAEPDPHFRTVESSDVPVYGISLEGAETFGADPALAFPALEGDGRVENQFFRTVGCSRSWQSRGQSNGYVIEMLTGAWGIVFSLSGVDDITNDDQVEVGIHANGDPIQLSPSREPLEYATYIIDQDPRFQARTRGQIRDGVLTTEPIDVRFHQVVNGMLLERTLRDARLQVTISEDGELEGYLSGYTPVEDMYDYQFGYRNGMDPTGGPAPLQRRIGSANGAAYVLGHTCHGVYHALYENADGHPDPETGQFTSISTQYKIEAIPAFVVDTMEGGSKHEPIRQTAGSE